MLNLDINESTILYLDGDSFEDNSQYKNSIINNGVTTNKSGRFGGCYDFTKSSTTITTSGVRLPQNTFTIEWWEKNISNSSDTSSAVVQNTGTETIGTYSLILGKAKGEDIPKIWASSNNSTWDIAPGTGIGNACLNVWVHRAVVNDGTNIKCYENGKLFTTINLNGKTLYPLDKELQFNSVRGASSPYSAYVDEIKIHNNVKWNNDFIPPLSQYSKVEDLGINEPLLNVANRAKLLNELKQSEKTLLKNNLIEMGVECSDSEIMLSLIDKVRAIPGKKWATGISKSNTSFHERSFNTGLGTSYTFYYTTISKASIGFVPKLIYVICELSGFDNRTYCAIYDGNSKLYKDGVVRTIQFKNGSSINTNNYTLIADSKIITSSNYIIPVNEGALNYTWYAFE